MATKKAAKSVEKPVEKPAKKAAEKTVEKPAKKAVKKAAKTAAKKVAKKRASKVEALEPVVGIVPEVEIAVAAATTGIVDPIGDTTDGEAKEYLGDEAASE